MSKNEISKMKSRERISKIRNQKRKAVSCSVEPEVQSDYERLRDLLREQIEDESLADLDLAATDKEHGRVCLTSKLYPSVVAWEKDQRALERLRYLADEGYLAFEGARAQYGGWTYTFRLTELGRLVARPPV